MQGLTSELVAALERDAAERFALPRHAFTRVERALARAAAAPEATALLAEALRLIIALEQDLGSPAAARALRARIRAVPAAHAVVHRLAPRALDATRRFRAQQGHASATRAPRHDTPPPPGAIQATRLIDPTQVDRARAASRTKKAPPTGRPQGDKR